MYLYAYTVRQINPSGAIETVYGSWSRDKPISTIDEYTKAAKEIGASCGFDNGVIESFSLIYSPDIAKPEKTIEQHRAEFEEWHKENMWFGRPSDEDYHVDADGCYFNVDVQVAWRGFQAARGVTE